METDKNYQLVKTYKSGYGHFKTIPVIKSVLEPALEMEQLLLIDTPSFTVTTNLVYFKNVLVNNVDNNSITKDYLEYCLDNLQSINSLIFSFSMSLPLDEQLFKKFKETVFNEAACLIWYKEQKKYGSEISSYQIIDHPAVGIGAKYECFSCFEIELYRYMISVF